MKTLKTSDEKTFFLWFGFNFRDMTILYSSCSSFKASHAFISFPLVCNKDDVALWGRFVTHWENVHEKKKTEKIYAKIENFPSGNKKKILWQKIQNLHYQAANYFWNNNKVPIFFQVFLRTSWFNKIRLHVELKI